MFSGGLHGFSRSLVAVLVEAGRLLFLAGSETPVDLPVSHAWQMLATVAE
jgi:hypothetical protein